MFAHTIIEVPKYGAKKREAAISIAITEAPVMNTYRYRKRIEKWLFKYSHLKLAK